MDKTKNALIEEEILEFWQKNNIFQKSLDKFREMGTYVFYDGPPFATGLPHYGHLLTGFIKDTIARFQTMNSNTVPRVFGWDCHGLPAEMIAEKNLAISGRIQIMEYGVDKFNAECEKLVLTYVDEWESYVTRQGRWVDFKNSYKTMNKEFMESVIWAFSELYKKGLVYEAMRVMPYSWACQTPLSNFETRLDDSYRERADKAITIIFELNRKLIPEDPAKEYVSAWTTTPWTLPSNLALAVGPNINYCAVKVKDKIIIIGENAFIKYQKDLGVDEGAIIKKFTGEELKDLSYKPLFNYFASHANSFKIITADFVTDIDGTGIVHMAPGFGEDDQIICAKNNIEVVCPVDAAGKFTNEVADFEGLQVFDANDEIIKALKIKGNWLKTEQYIHNYPHCWRTDTPLIYKAVPSWYVKVTAIKDRMCELNKEINWIPNHIRDGLFGKWLENAKDWSISRNRFWGTPIPIWKSDNPAYPRIDVYSSIAEMEKDFGVKINDLHKPFIDTLVRANPDDPTGKSLMRISGDVFDCWFESGSMPYAQVHYPFENKEWFENNFPADFIVEYVAQTRGWFYTLMVLSTALFDRPPFLNCICHGVILDEKGRKLSKRLQNYADPHDIFNKYGSDSLRLVMLSSPVMYGQELLIDKDGKMVTESLKSVIQPLQSACHFFEIYAEADKITPKLLEDSDNLLDKYLIGKTADLVRIIYNSMASYDTVTACKNLEKYIDILNNWYIRRSRERFWKKEYDLDKQNAYNSLFTCLDSILKAIAPLIPFTAEYLYRNLHKNKDSDFSVHLMEFPKLEGGNVKLVKIMDDIRDICSHGLAIRNQENIRIRQPLANAIIVNANDEIQKLDYLIKDELNVKDIIFENDYTKYATWKPKLNFPALAKKMPEKVKLVSGNIKNGDWKLDNNGNVVVADITLEQDECSALLEPSEKNIKICVDNMIIILDLKITHELYLEGMARDTIRLIQQMRKDMNFNITDKINITLKLEGENLNEAIILYKDYIAEQVLASEINISNIPLENAKKLKLDDVEMEIIISTSTK